MSRVLLVYVAGPFRGATPLDVRHNVESARDHGLQLAREGVYPVIPHTMIADFDKLLTDEFWLDGTMEMLRRCDALAAITGWSRSQGAMAEIKEATRLGIPRFYMDEPNWRIQLREWYTNPQPVPAVPDPLQR